MGERASGKKKKLEVESHLRPRWLKDKPSFCGSIKYSDARDIQKQNFIFCANKNNVGIHNSFSYTMVSL